MSDSILVIQYSIPLFFLRSDFEGRNGKNKISKEEMQSKTTDLD